LRDLEVRAFLLQLLTSLSLNLNPCLLDMIVLLFKKLLQTSLMVESIRRLIDLWGESAFQEMPCFIMTLYMIDRLSTAFNLADVT
jgi:hypothetical protein